MKNPFPWRPVEICRDIKWFCVRERVESEWADVCLCADVLGSHQCVSSFPPMTKRSVNKGRNCSSLIGFLLAEAQSTRTRVRIHSNTDAAPLVPPNDCSRRYLPAFFGLCAGMWSHEKRTVSCSFCISVDELMRGESERGREREREGVMSQFSLHSSFSHESAHALPSTHIIAAVMELFLPPPLLVFSLSAIHSHALSPFLLSVTLPSAICVSLSRALSVCHSWTPASSFCPFVLLRSCPSIPPSYSLF